MANATNYILITALSDKNNLPGILYIYIMSNIHINNFKELLNKEFNFTESHIDVNDYNLKLNTGVIFLAPTVKSNMRKWLLKANDYKMKGGRKIIMVIPVKEKCKYYNTLIRFADEIRTINHFLTYREQSVYTRPMIVMIYNEIPIIPKNLYVDFN